MQNRKLNIVVTGDIATNVLQWKTIERNFGDYSWQSYQQVHKIVKTANDSLVSKLLGIAVEANILSPKINCENYNLDNRCIMSLVELGLFPVISDVNDKNEVYRIKEFLGFSGPSTSQPRLYPIINDDVHTDIVILDDENNGFNNNEEFWPLAIKSKKHHN